jgi:hypothetical protein
VGRGELEGIDHLMKVISGDGQFAMHRRTSKPFTTFQCSRDKAAGADGMDIGEVGF